MVSLPPFYRVNVANNDGKAVFICYSILMMDKKYLNKSIKNITPCNLLADTG
ncbi:hypothetical protein [Mergibacter septicus]|uniref:hypothetical protein n=1 Tax=Mergibacter septicus TaxID=221402 RepID=UPI00223F1EC8|nr:hypothetical protein [Mergibacter septicus]